MPALPEIAIVIPCYNEQEVLPETSKRLLALLSDLQQENLIKDSSYVVFVDDGSRDDTWNLIEALNTQYAQLKGLKLSRNFGHQNALLAGLMSISGYDAVISVDADLQDDLNAIRAMVQQYNQGYDIVYGVRNDRTSDSFFKRNTALAFYKLMKSLGVETVHNHADFRLMSRRVVESLKTFNEVNLFLRGMVPLLGYRSTQVTYERKERFAGESKYPFSKMLSFAWRGITSLSTRPLHFVMLVGFLVFLLTIVLSVYVVSMYLMHATVPGWASTVLPIYFIGGVQLLCIGMVGEYVGKIYKEVKARPRFIIEKQL